MRPFEGIKIIDATHVLAGPFAAYQMAVLGAEVIKIDDPANMDQVREQGPDNELNSSGMGTYYLTQSSIRPGRNCWPVMIFFELCMWNSLEKLASRIY
jgi:hypothetical protein